MDQLPSSMMLKRVTVNLPEDLIIQVEEAQLDLRRAGRRISFSGMTEVALRELLKYSNLESVARRHGASARRTAANGSTAHTDGKPKNRR